MYSPQRLDPWLGQSIGDRQRYRLDQRLGGGGMGEVFLATDTILDQPVAVKLLDSKLVPGELRRRFEQEVAVVTALRSQHIVPVSDYGITPEGYPFYVMEYLQGQTLGQLLRRESVLPVERAIGIISQVCAGLQLAHQGVNLRVGKTTASGRVKVIHRDLKPDNIFLVPTALGELVKLLDFGIAKIRSDQVEHTNVTRMFLGTYRYAAPEQFEVGRSLDERADIYSLGIILYEMLTGTDPFGIANRENQMTGAAWGVAHLSKSVIPLRAQPGCQRLPRKLDRVVMRCLQKAPENRFSSVVELSQALHQAVPGSNDRDWELNEFPEEKIALNPPSAPAPTCINLSSPLADDITLSITQNYARSVAAVSNQSSVSAKRVGLPRKPSLLLASAGVAAVLVLSLIAYYFRQSSALVALQARNPSPEPTTSSQFTSQPDQPATKEPESAATKTLSGHADTVWAVAVAPDGKTLFSGSFDKTIKRWSLQTGKLLQTLTGHSDAVRAIAPAQNGQFMATGSSDKTIKIWNLRSGDLLRTLPADLSVNTGHAGPIWSISISPDGKTLVSGSYDGTVKVWDVATGDLLRTLPDHYDSVWSVAITSDSKTLASASYDGTIKIWDLQTGSVLRTLSGHTESVRSIAISPDGRTLASASWDKTIRLWNLQTGQLLRTLSGHNDRVLAVAFSPSGETFVSSSIDRTLKLWDVPSGKLLRTFSGHTDWVTTIAFSSDGKTIVSGSKDKTIKIWRWEGGGERLKHEG